MDVKTKAECHHDPQPFMTDAEIKRRTDELQQRSKCLDCGQRIFSEFWLKWKVRRDSLPALLEQKVARGWAIVDRKGKFRRYKDIDTYVPALYPTEGHAKDDMLTEDRKAVKVEVWVKEIVK